MSGVLRTCDGLGRAEIPQDPLTFLESLDGPTAWRVAGRDRSRLRVVTTLLHGNEPSGFLALHGWLRGGRLPAVDALCVIANVEAARLHPAFTQRSVPGRRDLNRCFLGPFDDREGEVARAILDLVEQQRPEALIDLHNNTGHNPAYAVGMEPSPEALALTALFGDRFVWSHLRLGALLEAVEICPAVTVEVGKSGSERADRVARSGAEKFLESESIFPEASSSEIRVLKMPMRAQIAPECRLVMAQHPHASADFTMPDDLDRHNFESVPAGSRIGWVRGEGCPLRLIDEMGNDRAAEYFERRGADLVARRAFMPIMITVDAEIAKGDCLFYVVNELSSAASG
jgi:hypothetical protein